ncbi:hypothetical protein C8R45DRAFT_206618 [Mycena sanguinolenta]|nr:hypothetical protein C8R45DRAFT_206618 [Mycena sanguinolenta]
MNPVKPAATPYIAPELERQPPGKWFLTVSSRRGILSPVTFMPLHPKGISQLVALHSRVGLPSTPEHATKSTPFTSGGNGERRMYKRHRHTYSLDLRRRLVLRTWSFFQRYPPTNPFMEPGHQAPSRSRILITGVPGIGKSVFTRFVLCLRCMAGLPTVYMNEARRLEVFHEGQRIAHEQVWNIEEVLWALPENTWIIVDTNPNFAQVPRDVTNTRFFILQVMPPCPEYAYWIKKSILLPRIIVMKPWSAEELITARWSQVNEASLAATDNQLREFVQLYGGSARDAYLFARKTATHEKDVDSTSLSKA